jgi:integrase
MAILYPLDEKELFRIWLSRKWICYLSDLSVQQLEIYLQEEHILVNDLMFTSTTGTGLKPDVLNEHFKAFCDRAGIKRGDRTQYSIRHTFYTKMLEVLDKETVNALMGHTRRPLTPSWDIPATGKSMTPDCRKFY